MGEHARPGAPLAVVVANRRSPHVAAWDRGVSAAGFERVDVDSHPPGPVLRVLLSILRESSRARRQIRAARRSGRRVVVHAHGAGRGALVATLLVTRHPSIIVYGSEVIFVRQKPQIERLLVRWVLRRASRVATNAASTNPYVLALAPDLEDRITVIFPPPRWDLIDDAALNARSGRPVRVLSIRRILPLYNIEELIAGFRRSAPGAGAMLTLLQGDVADENPYLGGIRRLVGTDPSVRLESRFLDTPALLALHAGHDIGVSVSSSDQMSASILESLGTGNVVVVSDLPAYKPLHSLEALVRIPLPVTADGVSEGLRRAYALIDQPGWGEPSARSARGQAVRAAFEASHGTVSDLL